MNDQDITDIKNKLALLERHIINLIFPTQVLNELHDRLQRPLTVDDRNFATLLKSINAQVREFAITVQSLDLSQTMGEIKFIGKRLVAIEKDIAELKKDGLTKKVKLDFTCDGYELVKRKSPKASAAPECEEFDPEQAIINLLDTLIERERNVLIHRYGLFGENKKTLTSIGRLFGISGGRVGQIRDRTLRKCRHPSRASLVKNLTNVDLLVAIKGPNYADDQED